MEPTEAILQLLRKRERHMRAGNGSRTPSAPGGSRTRSPWSTECPAAAWETGPVPMRAAGFDLTVGSRAARQAVHFSVSLPESRACGGPCRRRDPRPPPDRRADAERPARLPRSAVAPRRPGQRV